jgi:uncharacterized protein (TIGR02271 family)
MTSQERHILGEHGKHADLPARNEESEALVQLREEELAARKQQVEVGRVSVGTEIVQEEQTLEVPVTREELTIERHPVDRRPSDQPIAASTDVLRVPVHADQVSVDKQAVVYEEVNVGKRAVDQTQRVSETVRKEVVDVDATGEVQVRGEADGQR